MLSDSDNERFFLGVKGVINRYVTVIQEEKVLVT